ncbi:hypothetical protein PCC6912_50850 [Chlorogloeopsis fritschii PCC 6912]|uniref:Uncharacterized protein n=2 Tax=Chlorogloeopsis fritschii TaxID=1124 RepID=A0A433N1L8_CHLFR|nr:hypothetical protein PCC6912_50850 [Chlorogloeopsis fritschii PCC 6912]
MTHLLSFMTTKKIEIYLFNYILKSIIENKCDWLTTFDTEELLEFVQEIQEASEEDIPAIIHEWKESAIAIKSDLLAEAFRRGFPK